MSMYIKFEVSILSLRPKRDTSATLTWSWRPRRDKQFINWVVITLERPYLSQIGSVTMHLWPYSIAEYTTFKDRGIAS